jgi:serine/threonine protein kinase
MMPNLTVRTFVLADVDDANRSNIVLNYADAAKLISFSDTDNGFIPRMVCLFRHLNALHLVFNRPVVCTLAYAISKLGESVDRNSQGRIVLHHKQMLSNEEMQYIAAIVVSAIGSLHSMGIVYRNVHPEGLHFDNMGRVLLFDLTVAKACSENGRTFTLCGTSDYLSPEQIAQSGHNHAVDFWGIGVLLYELATNGENPFRKSSELQTYECISSLGTKAFPSVSLSRNASSKNDFSVLESLIQALLVPNPMNRLGANGKLDKLTSHPYFKNVKWNMLLQMQSPFFLFASSEQERMLSAAAAAVAEMDPPPSGVNTIPPEVSDEWLVSYAGNGWDEEVDITSPV